MQLAGYGVKPGDPQGGKWALLREAQAKALALPNTGMATAVDIGDEKDIHPRNKVDVANRLALLAENRVYGHQVLDAGPTFDSMKVEGSKIRVRFQNIGSGLAIAAPPAFPPAAPHHPPTCAVKAKQVGHAPQHALLHTCAPPAGMRRQQRRWRR